MTVNYREIADEPTFSVWGTGSPLREFLHVDDCADALVHIMQCYSDDEHINVGSGSDISIKDLAALVANVVGFSGEIAFDAAKPDGAPRKLMCSAKLKSLGRSPRVSLREGVADAYHFLLAGDIRQ